MSKSLGTQLALVAIFVMGGIIFEVLYFQVAPHLFEGARLSLPWTLLFWGLLVLIIVVIGISGLKYAAIRSLPFALGVMFLAYEVKDWYSFFIAIVGLVLSII